MIDRIMKYKRNNEGNRIKNDRMKIMHRKKYKINVL